MAEDKGYTLAGLLYVTADIAVPHKDLADSEKELRAKPGLEKVPLWWVSWRDLGPVLKKASRYSLPPMGSIARDAAACLQKWGLERYHGITVRPKPMPEYRFREIYTWPAMGLFPNWHYKKETP